MNAGPPRAGGERTSKYRMYARLTDSLSLEQQSIHKTFTYRLKPTLHQERTRDRLLMLCRHVYNAAIGERRDA